MCDICYNKNDENTPIKIDIKKYCEQLYKILDIANKKSIKLTALQLMDAWYSKTLPDSTSNTSQPSFERYVAEQIVITLLTENYLKEVLFYTDYNVISYLDKGMNQLNANLKIEFCHTKCYQLPVDCPKIKHTENTDSIILDIIQNKKEKFQHKRSRSDEKKKQNYDTLINGDDDIHSKSKKKKIESNSNSSTSKCLRSKNNNIGQSSAAKLNESSENISINSNKNNHNLLNNETLNESGVVDDELLLKKKCISPNSDSSALTKSLKFKSNSNDKSLSVNLIESAENICIDSNKNECNKKIQLNAENVDNIKVNDGDNNLIVIDDDLILITEKPIIIEID